MDGVSRQLITSSNSFKRSRKTSSSSSGSSGGYNRGAREKGGGGGLSPSPWDSKGGSKKYKAAAGGIGIGGGGEKGGKAAAGGRLSSSSSDDRSVRDLWLGKKGSSHHTPAVSVSASAADGAQQATASSTGHNFSVSPPDDKSERGHNFKNSWARSNVQVKIIAATRVRKGASSTGKFREQLREVEESLAASAAETTPGGNMLGAEKPKKGSGATRGRSPNKASNSLSPSANGAAAANAFRRRSSSSRRSPNSDKSGSRRGSLKDEKDKEKAEAAKVEAEKEEKLDALAELALKIKKLGALSTEGGGEGEEKGEDAKNLASICNVFAGGKMTTGKKTFKDFAREEMNRDPTEVDKMLASSKVIAAFGRRNFEKEEIQDEEEEEEEEPVDDNEELKFKVKAAKAKYLAMFEKKMTEEEKEKKKLEDQKPDPKAFGLWDTVHSLKALPTLMKVRKEWMPPDWENIVKELKEEGRDVASIDADLKDICHGTQDVTRKTTGKYLMPDDIQWCRKHARFREKDLLKWFRRFRERCPKGTMNQEEFKPLFKSAFPVADVDLVSEIVFEVFDPEGKQKLDFKEFLIPIDAVNCRQFDEKLRWGLALWDQKNRKAIDFYGMKRVVQLLDQIEENGFMDGATDEDMDEIFFRKKMDPPKLVEERVTDIFQLYANNSDGTIDMEEIEKTSAKIIYARE